MGNFESVVELVEIKELGLRRGERGNTRSDNMGALLIFARFRVWSVSLLRGAPSAMACAVGGVSHFVGGAEKEA